MRVALHVKSVLQIKSSACKLSDGLYQLIDYII